MAFKMKQKKDLEKGAKESDSMKKDLKKGVKESDSMKKDLKKGVKESDSMKKDLEKGAKESDSMKKDLKKGAKESDSRKTGPGGTLPHVVDAEKGKPGMIGSLIHSIAIRMAAGRKKEFPTPGQDAAAAFNGADKNAGKNVSALPEKKGGAGDVFVAGIKEDIAKAGEALKKKDFKAAEALYGSITANYNMMVSDPKCNIKDANAIYGEITAIYTALSRSRGGREEDIVFKPLNEAVASEKKEKNYSAPQAGEGAGKGTPQKLMPEEQVIYTAIDSVIEIVDSKGEISLQELSKILDMPPEQMEELAKILDEHGILQLHYPSNPLAHPLLRSISKHDFKRLGRQD